MVRRTTRWRKPPSKVLSLPTSQRTELCYAFEGKADYHGPLSGERVELLLIDQERHTRWVNSPPKFLPRYPVEEDVDGWRIVGWRLPSGDLRYGDYDVVFGTGNRSNSARSGSTRNHFSGTRLGCTVPAER